jgi:3-oxoacyl-[acyl-carrier protein] reductase
MIGAEGGDAAAYQADIQDAGQVASMVEALLHRWERLDTMICNAGSASSRLLLRLDRAEWTSVIETNLTGTFHCLKAAAVPMLERGQGSLIVIGSFSSLHGRAGQAAYAASKAGLIGLVKTAAREWGPRNVRVNLVFPGRHATALAGPSEETAISDHVLQRTPDLQGVARAIYQLALLPDASGQIWNLDSRLL